MAHKRKKKQLQDRKAFFQLSPQSLQFLTKNLELLLDQKPQTTLDSCFQSAPTTSAWWGTSWKSNHFPLSQPQALPPSPHLKYFNKSEICSTMPWNHREALSVPTTLLKRCASGLSWLYSCCFLFGKCGPSQEAFRVSPCQKHADVLWYMSIFRRLVLQMEFLRFALELRVKQSEFGHGSVQK